MYIFGSEDNSNKSHPSHLIIMFSKKPKKHLLREVFPIRKVSGKDHLLPIPWFYYQLELTNLLDSL